MSTFSIACVQTAPVFGDVARNLDEVGALLEGVRADVVVLPELFATGYSFRDRAEARSLAEPFEGGRTVERLRVWSEATGGMIVAGFAALPASPPPSSAPCWPAPMRSRSRHQPPSSS